MQALRVSGAPTRIIRDSEILDSIDQPSSSSHLLPTAIRSPGFFIPPLDLSVSQARCPVATSQRILILSRLLCPFYRRADDNFVPPGRESTATLDDDCRSGERRGDRDARNSRRRRTSDATEFRGQIRRWTVKRKERKRELETKGERDSLVMHERRFSRVRFGSPSPFRTRDSLKSLRLLSRSDESLQDEKLRRRDHLSSPDFPEDIS